MFSDEIATYLQKYLTT